MRRPNLTFAAWRPLAEAELKGLFALTFVDIGMSDAEEQAWWLHHSNDPRAFALAWGAAYDIERIDGAWS